MAKLTTFWRAHPLLVFSAAALGLTALRIAALIFADAELGPDEAQYWVWSQTPAFGYFSKPPAIAWAIAASTAVFGDGEWAVRLTAPFFHLGAAYFIFALARRLYGAATGFWAGAGWLTLPGVTLSAMLITTDAPLLFFWSAALYFFFRIIEAAPPGDPDSDPDDDAGGQPHGGYGFAILLGAAIGLGMLSKYAMIYFPLGAALALAISPGARRGFRLADAGIAIVVAGLIMAPNVVWNAAHDFRTLSHTAANADWRAAGGHPGRLAEFLAAQFGVFGPLVFALFVWGAATLPRRLLAAGAARESDLALLAFAAPPLVIVSIQAFISRAHANWAAAAYPAALILATAWAFRARIGAVVKASAALHLAAAAAFLVAMTHFTLIDAAGFSNAVKSVRGWEVQAAAVAEKASGANAILIDDREVMGAMLYYGRGGLPVVSWNSNHHIDDHYEAFMAYDPARAQSVLFVSTLPEPIAVAGRFTEITPAGEISVDLKRGRTRRLWLFRLSGYRQEKK